MSSAAAQTYDYLFVLDFEATCEDRTVDPAWKNEIIEFPIVALDVKTGKIESEFREYVRPTLNPILTRYCTDLTGIEQATVDGAETFPSVFAAVKKWYDAFCADHPGSKTIFLTCGDWDLRRMLPEQLQLTPVPSITMPCFDRWINVKKPFKDMFGNCKALGGIGMDTMLETLKIPLVGRHHSGLDDARNIAAIARELMGRGIVMRETWPASKK